MAQGWRIVATRGTEEPVNGRFVPMMEITAETDDGTQNNFRVPTAQYNPENVKATISEWYERHMAVRNL